MPKDFYSRLGDYFEKVADVLRGKADASSIFPNSSDVGSSREKIYIEFLRQHCPSKCNVFAGGFLFSADGQESKQMDAIVTVDAAPRYDFHNSDGGGKSFASVEGCLAAVTIKSELTKAELFNALDNLASIPPTEPLGKRANPNIKIDSYQNWPLKVVYASDGLTESTILKHLADFYQSRPEIPDSRRVDFIHVAGKYFIPRITDGMTVNNADGSAHNTSGLEYYALTEKSDLQAISWVLEGIQRRATAASHILFSYMDVLTQLMARINRTP